MSGNGSAAKEGPVPGKMEYSHMNELATNPKPVTRKDKIKKHCGRFWLWYLIAAIILAAILLPILFLVIIPAIAQDIVNGVSLPINYAALQATTNKDVIIGLKTALNIPAGLTVGLDDITLYLYNDDTDGFKPFTSVSIPGNDYTGNQEISIEGQKAEILDYDELNIWLTRTVNQAKTMLNVKGNTTAHLGELHFNIGLNKHVEVNALDKLHGVTLDQATIYLPAMDNGTNLMGKMTLPNWSDFHMGLGDLGVNLFAGDIRLGLAEISNVYLNPGNNTLPFVAAVDIDTLIANLMPILQSQAEPLSRGMVKLNFNGNYSKNAQGEHLEYLEKVLAVTQLSAEVPVVVLATDVVNSFLGGQLDITQILSLTSSLGDLADNSLVRSLLEEFLGNLTGGSDNSTDSSSLFGRDDNAKALEMAKSVAQGLLDKSPATTEPASQSQPDQA